MNVSKALSNLDRKSESEGEPRSANILLIYYDPSAGEVAPWNS